MNPSTPLRCRLLLAAGLFLAVLLPLRAENWQTATIDVSPARVNHSFVLLTSP